MTLGVFVVLKGAEVLSAWPNEYAAKFEAQRWEQDLKVTHDYVPGVLILEEVTDAAAD